MWSYTFTDYSHFADSSNAVTPRPNWPSNPSVDVLVSTTPPLNETDYNAMDFSQWKKLGKQHFREILIKSNINNWLICHPGTGSLLDWREGFLSCHVIEHVTDMCYDAFGRDMIEINECGPILKFEEQGSYYFFDGCTKSNWPVHDPCGASEENYLKNVANPHGNIFVR